MHRDEVRNSRQNSDGDGDGCASDQNERKSKRIWVDNIKGDLT